MFSLRLAVTPGAVRCVCSRTWRFAVCLTVVLTVASPAAQSTPGSAADGPSASDGQDHNVAVLKLAQPQLTLMDRANRESRAFAQQRLGSRDSLKNGAILGTVIGAAAFGVFAAALCNAYQEEDGASCLPDTLRFAAIGGAIGAGTGLAIDAVRSDRGVTVRLTVRF